MSSSSLILNTGGPTGNNSDGLSFTGGFTGSGNLTTTTGSSGTTGGGGISISGGGVNNSGTITNTGTSTNGTTISSAIGSNVTGVVENSATSGLTLTAANTYAGGTTVSAGTLTAGADGALGSGNVTVTGGSLTLTGGTTNDYMGDLASLILPTSNAASPFVTLSFTGTDVIGNLSFDNGATFLASGTYGAPGSGALFTNTDFVGSGILTVAGLAAAPEPSQWAAFGVGLLGLGGLALKARRRSRHAA